MLSKYISLFLFAVFLSSCAQIILKSSASQKNKSFVGDYLNIKVLTGYFILGITSLLSIIAYKGVALKTGSILQSFSYIFVTILSWMILDEPLVRNKIWGLILIVLGVIIFNI